MIEEKKKPQVEILSPAGSYESFLAAIHAGADAVYAGGPRFGARAFADNFTEETLKQAIDYAHFHGRKSVSYSQYTSERPGDRDTS